MSRRAISQTNAEAQRIERDRANARVAEDAAAIAVGRVPRFTAHTDMAHGTPAKQVAILEAIQKDHGDLLAIAEKAFDAMLEAEVSNANGNQRVLWYAHTKTLGNQTVTGANGNEIRILSWTHPGIQLGLSAPIDETADVKRSGLALKAVTPLARARFDSLHPEIAGLYEPGGRTGVTQPKADVSRGLKAVKLEMTLEQVHAFLNHMRGVLIITGAPGTGKTTVALQRIRFLFDQQGERDADVRAVPYTPELTKVLLASRNLIAYTRSLLRDELQIPADVVSHVHDFIQAYVDRVWEPKLDARLTAKRFTPEELRAREAMVNLGTSHELHAMWKVLESQVRERLKSVAVTDWTRLATHHSESPKTVKDLLEAFEALPRRHAIDPQDSQLRLDAVWSKVGHAYERMRNSIKGRRRDELDDAFARWLFHTYDPLDVLSTYFSQNRPIAIQRIRQGVGTVVDAAKVVEEALGQWSRRRYSVHELGWIGWMLRFWLPEERDVTLSFRGVPRALEQANSRDASRWTHIVIDEAQDLSVQEASLLASFVHPNGALTVSADFRQVVSPVHGAEDAEALKVGLPIRDQRLHRQFPFKQNMRQSREIAMFLADFYERSFGEYPEFTPGPRRTGFKPQLHTGPARRFARLVRQVMNVFQAKGEAPTVAILFTDESDLRMRELRAALHTVGVSPAPIDEVWSEKQLVMTTVERAKGLEYDTCFVVGLDDVERSSLNFAKNRAYVALSRPTTRLIMLCQQYPGLLRHIRKDLFDHHQL